MSFEGGGRTEEKKEEKEKEEKFLLCEIIGHRPLPKSAFQQQVIQGSHMVSCTQCPAWNDQMKKWSGSRAAAPKGQYPVGHG